MFQALSVEEEASKEHVVAEAAESAQPARDDDVWALEDIQKLEKGKCVWARFRCYPFWPARVYAIFACESVW